MNLTVIVLLLLLLVPLSMASLSQDNGTILAVPVLPPNDDPDTSNCTEGFYGRENGMIVSYQSNADAMGSLLYLHTSQCEKCASCVFGTLRENVEQHMHVMDFEECSDEQSRCVSWRKICKNEVSGISFQNLDDQSFAGIFTSFGEYFQQVFAIYPTPLQPYQKSSWKNVYHIIHGQHQHTGLLGLTIQNPYDVESRVSINLTSPAIAWYNGKELNIVESEVNIKCRGVLWVEPTFNGSGLGATILTSTSPLNVFTNWALFENNNTEYGVLNAFEYNSHLVHQMPERAHWGNRFIVSGHFSKILPDEIVPTMRYEITIVSYSPDNTITLKSKISTETLKFREVAVAVSKEQYEYQLHLSQTEMLQNMYLEITSISPISVLSEAFSVNITGLKSVYYSTLVQPVEWHANKQIAVLAHPLENTTYYYHIGITIPSSKNNLSEILESEISSYCEGVPISSYLVNSYPIGDEYYLLVYHRSMVKSNQSQTRLLLHHGDGHTGIGVTVHAYSEDFHYSYSNGYTLGGNFTDGNDFCPNPTTKAPASPVVVATSSTNTKIPIVSGTIGSAVLAITFTLTVLVLYITWRKRRRKKLLGNSSISMLQQCDGDYSYDIFILCADKDEDFVVEYIERPLEKCGYRMLRKNTAPNGLFALGGTIVSDIDQVTSLCARVIVVCSENYNSKSKSEYGSYSNHSKVEINCCKESMASRNGRVIPIILDHVEDTDFVEFTQHRIRSAEITQCSKLQEDFIKRLKRDLNIRKPHFPV